MHFWKPAHDDDVGVYGCAVDENTGATLKKAADQTGAAAAATAAAAGAAATAAGAKERIAQALLKYTERGAAMPPQKK